MFDAGANGNTPASRAGKVAKPPKRPSRAQMQLAEERARRETEAATWRAHQAARQASATTAPAPPRDAADRRIDAVAERFMAGPRRGPRIRGL